MEKIDLNLLAKSNPPQTIREHTDELLTRAVVLKDIYNIDEHEYYLLTKACEYHDYGKFNSEFQNRIQKKYKFDANKEIPHALLSLYFINKDEFDNEDYEIICYAIAYHHNMHENMINSSYIYSEKLIEKLLEPVEHYLVNRRVIAGFKKICSKKNTVIVKGLLHRCDYAASAGIPVEVKNDFLNDCLDNFMSNLKEENPGAGWNLMQEFCQQHGNENLVITAATGMGKTEAALKWIGNNKGIYILPLRSAINGIYSRLEREILKGEKIDEHLGLLHSDNISFLINDEFDNGITDYKQYGVKAKQWSMPLTISTPDQLFDFVFKANGYECKLATATYSKIVIDEIQAYNSILLAYIIKGIHEIMKMGGKVAVFTATLPPYVNELLCNKDGVCSDKDGEYNFTQQHFPKDELRHNLCSITEKISVERIISEIESNTNKNKDKVLIICNTVKKAQKLYEELIENNNLDYDVRILHSKFIQKDRRRLEQEITKDGKTDSSSKVIWITTQIVEASLDIDFDLLFTELSELCGLFQRLGRCNRKGKKEVIDHNCYVFLEGAEKLHNANSSAESVVDKDLYQLSKDAIRDWKGEISEAKKTELINTYFTFDNLKRGNFIFEFREAYQSLDCNPMDITGDEAKKKFRDIQSQMVIPKSVYMENEQIIIEAKDKLESLENLSTNQKVDEYMSFKNQILDYTLNVGYVKDIDKYMDFKIGKYQTIKVVECEYDKSGFRWGTNKNGDDNFL